MLWDVSWIFTPCVIRLLPGLRKKGFRNGFAQELMRHSDPALTKWGSNGSASANQDGILFGERSFTSKSP
jgi:hypothetical protein